MKRILVTGADGFIGQHLLPWLSRAGYETRALPGRPQLYPDLEDRVEDVDICLHLAARVGRVNCEGDPMDVSAVNAGLTYTLAQLCAERDTQMVYVSTSEAPHPNGIYGLSKAWGEQAVAFSCPDALIVRLFMPYGTGHPPGVGRAALTNFLYNAMMGEPLLVHAKASRSWCWVEDTCRGIVRALDENMSLNIGRIDNETSMYDVALMACEQVGASKHLIEIVPLPGNVSASKRPDVGPLYALGWEPLIDLEEGMMLVHRWLVQEMEGDLAGAVQR